MSERVPASQIEGLVGAHRHPTEHIVRGDSPSGSGVAYIMHPAVCLARYDDVRECPWSLALTRGEVWLPDDLPHRVRLRNGELITDMTPWKDCDD